MTAPAILFVFAHPDDESFSASGTAMKYAAEGVASVLVTATRGERGKAGEPPVCAPEELPALREQELREAAAIIGFSELQILDYKDRQLADAPVEEIRCRLVGVIRRVRPLVVATFDPNGFNVHPDHVAISRFTTEALAAAADPRFCPDDGAPYAVPRLVWTPLVAPWELPAGAELASRAGTDFVIDVTPYRERRVAALRAHRTQHLSIDRLFFSQPDPESRLGMEVWRQAWGPPLRQRPSADLFEGIGAAPRLT
jgi:LmbE family N-acetylglucosaminyl deacetylase